MLSRVLLTSLIALSVAGCGGGVAPARTTVRQALMNIPELLEFESASTRLELFREVARASLAEAGRDASAAVLFPIAVGDRLIAAPGFDLRADLLQAPDAGTVLLTFDSRADGWPEDRREALQGLSEREVAELVARSLISAWALGVDTEIAVDRAAGAPYAAAYVDGILRINPAFLYLAATAAPSSGPAGNQ